MSTDSVNDFLRGYPYSLQFVIVVHSVSIDMRSFIILNMTCRVKFLRTYSIDFAFASNKVKSHQDSIFTHLYET